MAKQYVSEQYNLAGSVIFALDILHVQVHKYNIIPYIPSIQFGTPLYRAALH